MFKRLAERLRDMRTIKLLCEAAERHARTAGQPQPGEEHFLLAALDLPEDSARRAFSNAGLDPERFAAAIDDQYRAALAQAGIAAPVIEPVALPQARGLYRAQPSGQALMQRLPALREEMKGLPLLGAHVVLAASAAQHGVTARALEHMGGTPAELAAGARKALGAARR